jgi:hypothetical protein
MNRFFQKRRTKWIRRRIRFYKRIRIIFMKMRRIEMFKNIILSLSKLSRFSSVNIKYKHNLKSLKVFKLKKKIFRFSFFRRLQRKFYKRFVRVQRRRYKKAFGFRKRKHFYIYWANRRQYYAFRREFYFRRKMYRGLFRKELVKVRSINLSKQKNLFLYKRYPIFFFKNDNYFYYNYFMEKKKFYYMKWLKNIIFFYNKTSLNNFYPLFKKCYPLYRGFSNILFFYSILQYTFKFRPFVFYSDTFKEYLKRFDFFPNLPDQFIIKKLKTEGLQESPFLDKFKRLRALEFFGTNSLLYGYKFHFVGRFTRKQKAASLWFSRGANSVSSMKIDLDYGFHTVTLRYSACTLKVWLYKNKGYSYKYGYRLV